MDCARPTAEYHKSVLRPCASPSDNILFYENYLSALWREIRREEECISKAFSKSLVRSCAPLVIVRAAMVGRRSDLGAEFPVFELPKPGG
jgi:hypothetical protein